MPTRPCRSCSQENWILLWLSAARHSIQAIAKLEPVVNPWWCPRSAAGSGTGTAKVVAVGSHCGPSASSGHWTAAHRVRGQHQNQNQNAPSEWIRFDDRRVLSETVRSKSSLANDDWRKTATVVAYATVPGRNGNQSSSNSGKTVKNRSKTP